MSKILNTNRREAIIAKYTDKSRYMLECIYGDVYVDEKRFALSKTNDDEREIFERELKTAIRFSKHFNCEVFLLPPDENGKAIYKEKHSNPDSIILGRLIDFKDAKSTDTSITRQIERGLKQADGIIITLTEEISIKKTTQWLNGKLNAMKSAYEGFIVVIEDKKNNYWTYTVNGKRLSEEESLLAAAQRLSPPGLESFHSQVD